MSTAALSPVDLLPTGEPADPDELVGKRARPRHRTAIACTLIHGIHRERHPGTVRDIHLGGARIRPSCDPSIIAGAVRLEVGGQSFRARVAWRRERELGLQFLEPASHTDAQVAALRATLEAMRRATAVRPPDARLTLEYP